MSHTTALRKMLISPFIKRDAYKGPEHSQTCWSWDRPSTFPGQLSFGLGCPVGAHRCFRGIVPVLGQRWDGVDNTPSEVVEN